MLLYFIFVLYKCSVMFWDTEYEFVMLQPLNVYFYSHK